MRIIENASRWAARRNPSVWLWWGAVLACTGWMVVCTVRTVTTHSFAPKTKTPLLLVKPNGVPVDKPVGL